MKLYDVGLDVRQATIAIAVLDADLDFIQSHGTAQRVC